MNREIIDKSQWDKYNFDQLTYFEDIYIDDDCDDDSKLLFEVVDSTIDSYDEGHGGSITRETIFKRISDNKYFCMISIHGYDYFEIEEIKEVFPITKTIVVYE